eukprot:2859620-Amphidinium_carterae.4
MTPLTSTSASSLGSTASSNLSLLASVLKTSGVPSPIVDVAMATYRGPKVLTLGSLSKKADYHRTCGMPAGCPLAVYFLSILSATLFTKLQLDHGDALHAGGYVEWTTLSFTRSEQRTV